MLNVNVNLFLKLCESIVGKLSMHVLVYWCTVLRKVVFGHSHSNMFDKPGNTGVQYMFAFPNGVFQVSFVTANKVLNMTNSAFFFAIVLSFTHRAVFWNSPKPIVSGIHDLEHTLVHRAQTDVSATYMYIVQPLAPATTRQVVPSHGRRPLCARMGN